MKLNKLIILTAAFSLLFVFGASESFAQRNKAEKPVREVNLEKDKKKNSYTIFKEGEKYFLRAENVYDPLTKKLLEGRHVVSYGCETPQAIQSQETAWSKGRSARIGISCAVLIKPKVLLMDEPDAN